MWFVDLILCEWLLLVWLIGILGVLIGLVFVLMFFCECLEVCLLEGGKVDVLLVVYLEVWLCVCLNDGEFLSVLVVQYVCMGCLVEVEVMVVCMCVQYDKMFDCEVLLLDIVICE